MNDYDEQLTGGTLPELTDEERLKLQSELEYYQGELAEPEPEPQIAAPEATAPVQPEPEVQPSPVQEEKKIGGQTREEALAGATL